MTSTMWLIWQTSFKHYSNIRISTIKEIQPENMFTLRTVTSFLFLKLLILQCAYKYLFTMNNNMHFIEQTFELMFVCIQFLIPFSNVRVQNFVTVIFQIVSLPITVVLKTLSWNVHLSGSLDHVQYLISLWLPADKVMPTVS